MARGRAPLSLMLVAFAIGSAYTWSLDPHALGWPVAVPFGVGLAWLARALAGWWRGSAVAMDPHVLDRFRDSAFWSRPARYSYAAVLVCDGFFLVEVNPESPAMFFVFAALSMIFSIEIGAVSVALGLSDLALIRCELDHVAERTGRRARTARGTAARRRGGSGSFSRDALSATASAWSPLSISFHSSSRPFRLPLGTSFTPLGLIVTVYGIPSTSISRRSSWSSLVVM